MGFRLSGLIKLKKFFLPVLGAAVVNMSSKSESSGSNLTLYFHPQSFYSRKVVLTLEEKRVPYKPHKVEIMFGEQYKPWYMALSPRGEVPALQDGEKVILDSKKIIDYLEDNFSYGNYVSLMGQDLDPSTRATISELRKQIDAIDGNLLGFGLLFHDEYVNSSDVHYPFTVPGIRMLLRRDVVNKPESLRELAENLPDYKDVLLSKVEFAENTKTVAMSKELFAKEVEAVQALLSDLEDQLSKQDQDDGWLCCDKFTQADVSLTLLLDRIWKQGAADFFLSRHPRLRKYLDRAINRDAYKRTEATFWQDWRQAWPLAIGFLLVVLLIIIGVCMILTK